MIYQMNRRKLLLNAATALLSTGFILTNSRGDTIYGTESLLEACKLGPVEGKTIHLYSDLNFKDIEVYISNCTIHLTDARINFISGKITFQHNLIYSNKSSISFRNPGGGSDISSNIIT